jgi:hypothetical protein
MALSQPCCEDEARITRCKRVERISSPKDHDGRNSSIISRAAWSPATTAPLKIRNKHTSNKCFAPFRSIYHPGSRPAAKGAFLESAVASVQVTILHGIAAGWPQGLVLFRSKIALNRSAEMSIAGSRKRRASSAVMRPRSTTTSSMVRFSVTAWRATELALS